jgi:hypothetical protein
MSITSAKSGATGISLALDNNFMEPIASTLVGAGGVNQVTFNDIPQTYKHLQIRGISRPTESGSTGGQYVYLRMNADAGTSYARHFLTGDGSTATAAGAASQTEIRASYQLRNGFTAGIYAAVIVDILDYSNTNKYKTTRSLGGFDSNGGGYAALGSGLWMNTNSINSLTLLCEVGDFVQYSRFSLYGIKG